MPVSEEDFVSVCQALEEAQADRDALALELRTVQRARDRAEAERDDSRATAEALEEAVTHVVAELDEANKAIFAQGEEIDRLKGVLESLRRQRTVEVEDVVHAHEETIEKLRTDNESLRKQLVRYGNMREDFLQELNLRDSMVLDLRLRLMELEEPEEEKENVSDNENTAISSPDEAEEELISPFRTLGSNANHIRGNNSEDTAEEWIDQCQPSDPEAESEYDSPVRLRNIRPAKQKNSTNPRSCEGDISTPDSSYVVDPENSVVDTIDSLQLVLSPEKDSYGHENSSSELAHGGVAQRSTWQEVNKHQNLFEPVESQFKEKYGMSSDSPEKPGPFPVRNRFEEFIDRSSCRVDQSAFSKGGVTTGMKYYGRHANSSLVAGAASSSGFCETSPSNSYRLAREKYENNNSGSYGDGGDGYITQRSFNVGSTKNSYSQLSKKSSTPPLPPAPNTEESTMTNSRSGSSIGSTVSTRSNNNSSNQGFRVPKKAPMG